MYSASIICDSRPAHLGNPHRLTTFVVTFPRFILAEFNTHRMLSRNAASSRAVPVAKIIHRIKSAPFVPDGWGANRPGMQASEDILEQQKASSLWLEARDKAVHCAEQLALLGVHKQLVNRLLEPFSWVTVVITATDWDNFFHLRAHPDAQPQFQIIAKMMQDLYVATEPLRLEAHEWHLPFISKEDRVGSIQDLVKISVGRCARVSYLTHDGRRDISEDIKLANSLQANGHMSPFEHAAVCQQHPHRVGNFTGWTQARKLLRNEADPKGLRI